MTKADHVFLSDYSLKTIGSGTFENCSSCTSFANVFFNCYSLESIPTDTFKNCSSALYFRGAFFGSLSLTSIPEGLLFDCVNLGYSTEADIPTNQYEDGIASMFYSWKEVGEKESYSRYGDYETQIYVTTKECSLAEFLPRSVLRGKYFETRSCLYGAKGSKGRFTGEAPDWWNYISFSKYNSTTFGEGTASDYPKIENASNIPIEWLTYSN